MPETDEPVPEVEPDVRFSYANERTFLAWNRTALSLMAFGFLIERFGLFLQMVGRREMEFFHRQGSFLFGIALILFGAILSAYSALQHKRVLKTLRPIEIPERYDIHIGIFLNGVIAVVGVVLGLYLWLGLG